MCFFQPVEYSNPNIQKLDIEFAQLFQTEHAGAHGGDCGGVRSRSWCKVSTILSWKYLLSEEMTRMLETQKERQIGLLLIFHLCAPGRAPVSPFFLFFIIAFSNPGSLQHLLSLMPQKNRKRRPLPGIFFGQYVVVMWTQYCLNVANDSWQPLLQDVTF